MSDERRSQDPPRGEERSSAETLYSEPEAPPTSRRLRASSLPEIDPGRYEIHAVHARGGIGRIFQATDVRLDRPVAVKELLDPEDAAGAARFVREALITARLQHPGIVPIYEAGRWPGGRPFYAMKLLSGLALDRRIAAAGTLARRLALVPSVLAVAEAMAYAHSRRIIHRDLKPSNILIGEFGETVVIDWGLARSLDEELDVAPAARTADQDARLTVEGAVMGTPAYMPPEQALGRATDERADVYAIGAILYEVLAGSPPYGVGSASDALTQVRLGPPPPLAERAPGAPRELQAIVVKAMARAPEERYPSAAELAEDLRRFQTGQIVAAHSYTRGEQLVRFARRNRAAIAVALLGALLVLAQTAISVRRIVLAQRVAEQERDRAEGKQREAEAAQRQSAERADDLALAHARAEIAHDPNLALELLRGLSPSFHRWTEARLAAADALAGGPSRVIRHPRGVGGMALSPDAKTLATACDDTLIRLIDVRSGAARALSGHEDEVYQVSFSGDGRRLLSAGKDGTLRSWDLETGAARVLAAGMWPPKAFFDAARHAAFPRPGQGLRLLDVERGHERALCGPACAPPAAFSPDGARVAFVEGRSLILEALDGGARRRLPWPGGSLRALVFSPGGDRLAAGDGAGAVRLWDLKGGAARVLRGHTDAVSALAFSADGRWLASGARDRSVYVWDLASGVGRAFVGHGGEIQVIRFAPSGLRIFTGSLDRTVRVWDRRTGASQVLHGFENTVSGVELLPSRDLAAASYDGALRIWDRAVIRSNALAQHEGPALRVAWSPDGRLAASAGEDGVVRVRAAGEGASEEVTELRGHEGPVADLAFAPGGGRLASAGADGTVRLWDPAGGPGRVLGEHGGAASRLAFSPAGGALFSLGADRAVRRWDLAGGAGRALFELPAPALFLALSPDGRRVAAGGEGGVVWLWAEGDGAPHPLRGHHAAALGAAFSPDGRTLATGSRDHTVRLWDLEGGGSRAVQVHGATDTLAFLSGARLLAAGGGTAPSLIDTATAALRRLPRGHGGLITALSVSPDGTRAATAGGEGTVLLWDLEAGERRELGAHAGQALTVAFSPDGRAVLSGGADGSVRVWTDDLPQDPGALRAWLDRAVPPTIALPEGNR